MTTVLVTLLVLAFLLVVANVQELANYFGMRKTLPPKRDTRMLEADPLASLNQAVDDGVASIQNAKKGLENYRTLISSVQRQVESGEKEKARLESKIMESLEAGDPNRTAGEYALILADVEQNLQSNRDQLLSHKDTYENFAKQVEIGQRRVLEAREKAMRLGLELEQSKREKEMAQFAREFSFDPDGLNTDLARAEELIYRKIDANRAVRAVVADMSKLIPAEAVDEDIERNAAAKEILKRFKQQS
jgi:phage shock protein A